MSADHEAGIEALRSAGQAVLNARHGTFAQINRALDALDSTLRGLSRAPSPELVTAKLVRTLRDYIAAPEGSGPVRYAEALELCDEFLAGSAVDAANGQS